jgi:hypothetical protein
VQAELLAGQKLQGVLTSNEVQSILQMRRWEGRFPLFTTINGERCYLFGLCTSCAVKQPAGCKLWSGEPMHASPVISTI